MGVLGGTTDLIGDQYRDNAFSGSQRMHSLPTTYVFHFLLRNTSHESPRQNITWDRSNSLRCQLLRLTISLLTFGRYSADTLELQVQRNTRYIPHLDVDENRNMESGISVTRVVEPFEDLTSISRE